MARQLLGRSVGDGETEWRRNCCAAIGCEDFVGGWSRRREPIR